MRRRHVDSQHERLSQYQEYFSRINQLPADSIDGDISRLAARFGFVGRAPEWYEAFNELVDTVVNQQLHVGDNEPALRVAQNDFLLQLERQLALFWRYDELRQRVFDDNNAELVRAFSYFEQHYSQDRRQGATFDADRFARFIAGIEHKLALRSDDVAPVSQTERLLCVDHQARIEAWADMKDNVLVQKVDPVIQFNKLREVLVQAPEWRQELSVFRSAMHVQRLMDSQFEASGMEMDETERFMTRMTARIDEELPTDVIFRTLEQELLNTGEHEEALSLVRTQIAFELRQRGQDCATNIMNYKRRFIESIWAAREPTAGVRPLFGRGNNQSLGLSGNDSGLSGKDSWPKR